MELGDGFRRQINLKRAIQDALEISEYLSPLEVGLDEEEIIESVSSIGFYTGEISDVFSQMRRSGDLEQLDRNKFVLAEGQCIHMFHWEKFEGDPRNPDVAQVIWDMLIDEYRRNGHGKIHKIKDVLLQVVQRGFKKQDGAREIRVLYRMNCLKFEDDGIALIQGAERNLSPMDAAKQFESRTPEARPYFNSLMKSIATIISGRKPVNSINQKFEEIQSDKISEKGVGTMDDKEQIMIFISHSSDDAEATKKFLECLNKALIIPENTIRCTSIDGYKLDIGDDAPQVLRNEISNAHVVVGLISVASLKSHFVIMELGASWGLEIATCPLLLPGTSFKDLPGPLSGRHTGYAVDHGSVANMIDVISKKTGFKKVSSTPMISQAISDFNEFIGSIEMTEEKVVEEEFKEPITDEEDAMILIQSWQQSRDHRQNRKAIEYSKVDDELGLIPGLAKKVIVEAFRDTYDVEKKTDRFHEIF